MGETMLMVFTSTHMDPYTTLIIFDHQILWQCIRSSEGGPWLPESSFGAGASPRKEPTGRWRKRTGEVTFLLLALLGQQLSTSWGTASAEKSPLPQYSMHQGISSKMEEALDAGEVDEPPLSTSPINVKLGFRFKNVWWRRSPGTWHHFPQKCNDSVSAISVSTKFSRNLCLADENRL